MTVGAIAGGLVAALTLVAATGVAAKGLTYCSEGSPESFSPARITSGTAISAAAEPLYNRLVEFERGTTNLQPALAQSYTISPDGLTYTFVLRPNVAFHTTAYFRPTRPLNADDVLFSIERQWKKDHPFNGIGGGKYQYFDDLGMATVLDQVVKRDAMTVEMVLKAPLAPFLTNIAMPFLSIYSKEYADQLLRQGRPADLDERPVGTGPFQLLDYQKDVSIHYTAHPGYFGGRAALDTLTFAITLDPAERLAKLRAGDCQIMVYPPPAALDALKKDPALKLFQQAGLNVSYIAFNVEKPPFADRRVRQALNLAVNKRRLVEAVFPGGVGEAAVTPLPPTIGWAYNRQIKDYAYDPRAARKLLDEAGVAPDTEIELWVPPVSRVYLPDPQRVAEIIKADWGRVGLKVRLVSDDWANYLRRTRAGEHQAALLGWTGDTGDPDNFLYELLSCGAAQSGGNRARWCHPAFDTLLDQARRTSDRGERARLYQEAQNLFKDEAPWVTLAHSVQSVPVASRVEGFRVDPLGRMRFYGVSLR